MALGKFVLRVIRLSPVSIVLPMLHTYFQLHVALTRRIKGQKQGTFQKEMLFREPASKAIKIFAICA
jgi:hypothetical protein